MREVLGEASGYTKICSCFSWGHVESAEQEIPDRKKAGEILVDGLGLTTVMPTMEGWCGDEETKWTEIPVHTGMNEDGVESKKGSGGKGDPRVESEEKKGADLKKLADEVVDGVDADTAEPIEVFGAVVDGVERPPAAKMKETMGPVRDEICQKVDFESLNGDGLAGKRTESRVSLIAEIRGIGKAEKDEQSCWNQQCAAAEQLCEKRGDEPVGNVSEPALTQEGPSGPAKQALDDEEDKAEGEKTDKGAFQGR